jgi:hypothetical protein
MPRLTCHDGDLHGFGCISSQFADALFDLVDDTNLTTDGDSQWFGKITRFLYELELSGTRIEEEAIKEAITKKQITKCTVTEIKYTLDPHDPTTAYADGKIEIKANAGSPIPDGTYTFKHTLKLVWRITDTKFS